MSTAGKGLSPKTVRSMLAEEIGDGDGEVNEPDETVPEAPPPHPPPPPPVPQEPGPPVPPAATAPMDMQQLIAALVAGITQANAGTAEAMRAALDGAATAARNPIPESYLNGGFPEKSVFSHPDGDLKHPRTKLRCPMFLGIYDDDGRAKPAFEIYEDTCTEWEREQLNLLRPGVYRGIERNDGVMATWRVVQQSDDNGLPIRLVIAVPQTWLSQEQFQLMPGQPSFLRQLNAADRA